MHHRYSKKTHPQYLFFFFFVFSNYPLDSSEAVSLHARPPWMRKWTVYSCVMLLRRVLRGQAGLGWFKPGILDVGPAWPRSPCVSSLHCAARTAVAVSLLQRPDSCWDNPHGTGQANSSHASTRFPTGIQHTHTHILLSIRKYTQMQWELALWSLYLASLYFILFFKVSHNRITINYDLIVYNVDISICYLMIEISFFPLTQEETKYTDNIHIIPYL